MKNRKVPENRYHFLRNSNTLAARFRQAGPMRDKRQLTRSEIDRADYESEGDFPPEEAAATLSLMEYEAQNSDCWCHYCFGEAGPRGQDPKCEYYQHHCDLCHSGKPKLCTLPACLLETK